jgi:hypothetical protein
MAVIISILRCLRGKHYFMEVGSLGHHLVSLYSRHVFLLQNLTQISLYQRSK